MDTILYARNPAPPAHTGVSTYLWVVFRLCERNVVICDVSCDIACD